jgi:Protein of unknown function (DUF4238)
MIVDLKECKNFTTNPINVAVERDFHRIDVDGHEPDAIENAFSDFETKLDAALRRIAAARSIQNKDDRAVLFEFISLLAIKNPQLRKNFSGAHEQTSKIILDLITATPESWASHLERARKDGYVPATADIPYEQARDFVRCGQFRIETPASMHLGMELGNLPKIVSLIHRRNWILFKAPEQSTGFITSDHPATVMWCDPERRDFYGPGLGLAQTQLLFPVSRELALIGAFEVAEAEVDASDNLIAQINGSVILHAGRQVYARDASFTYQWKEHERPVSGDRLVSNVAERAQSGHAEPAT